MGSRLVAEFDLDGLAVTQETVLWDGEPGGEFRTHVDGSIGQDRMLRIRFPANVPGGLPLYETATAVIGRPFGIRTWTRPSIPGPWTTRPTTGSGWARPPGWR